MKLNYLWVSFFLFFVLLSFVSALPLFGLNGSFEDCSEGCGINEQPVDWNVSYYSTGYDFGWDVKTSSYATHGDNTFYEHANILYQQTYLFYLLSKSKVLGGTIYFDMPYINNGWGFFCDAGSLSVIPQFLGDDGQTFDLNSFGFSGGCDETTSVYDFVSVIPRYPGEFRVKTNHYVYWPASSNYDQIYYDNFRYTKGTGERDIDSDGIVDGIDNCPFDYNPSQTDSDQFYFDNFNDGNINNFTFFDGNWIEENGVLSDVNTEKVSLTKALITDTKYPKNLELTAKIRIDSWQSGDVSGRAGIGLRTSSSNGNGYVLTFRDSNQVRFLSDAIIWGPSTAFNFDLNEWYWMKMQVKDSNLFGKVWEDGEQEPTEWMLEWQRSDYGWGYPSLVSGYSGSTTVSFDEVSVEALDFNVGDSVGDACDTCVNVFNIDQNDVDGDGLGDYCDGSIEGYLRITSPGENGSVMQNSLVQATFTVKNINGEYVEPLSNPQYRLNASDWNAESFSGGYGNYKFYFMAPTEIGEHTIKVKAYANNTWLSHKIKFNVIPHDTDIKINSVKAIQVIEDVNLIAGKATAVKVEATSFNGRSRSLPVTVRLEFNDKNFSDTKEFLGDYNFMFYVDNPYETEGTYQITAEASVDEIQEKNQENNQKTISVDVVETKSMDIRFRPVDLNMIPNSYFKYNKYSSSGDNFYVSNEKDFKTFASLHGNFLEGTYPVKEVNITENLKVYCPLGSNSCELSSFEFWLDSDVFIDYTRMMKDECSNAPKFCRSEEDVFKKIVGLTDIDWFEEHGYPPITGYAKFYDEKIPVFVEFPFFNITAHELGHGFGLCEEYAWDLLNPIAEICVNRPPENCVGGEDGKCYGKISDPGVWVGSGIGYYKMEMYSVDNNVFNKNNVFNYMGSTDISYTPYSPNLDPKTLEFRRFTDKVAYNHLIDKLKVSSERSGEQEDLNILLISGMINKNFDVNLTEWLVINGGSEFGSEDGNCLVKTLDENSMTLNDYNFSLMFEKYPEADFNNSLLWMGIQFDANISKVQIWCHDENIAERTVSDNAPELEITSPSGGEEWDYVHSITWNASDADGDQLVTLLKYSDDNGTTWNSLDYNVTDTNYQFDVGMVDGNTSYKIKVIATDGILTSEAVSETFTILNPDITVIPNEWDLGLINNLQNISQDFNIVNTGNADLNVFDVNYSVDLNVTGLSLPIVLQPGEGQVFNVELEVLDMNLGVFSKDINLSSNDPNQVVERIEIFGEIEEAKPDFKVSYKNITFNSVYPEQDENVQISALVENLGDLNASDVNVLFYGTKFDALIKDSYTVSLYHANSGSGTALIDETGIHDGSFKAVGEPVWDSNSMFEGYALNFDGNNDYVSIPDHDELDLSDELTVEFWFYSNGWSGSQEGLFAKRNYGGNEKTNYGVNTKLGNLQWYFNELGGSWQIISFSLPDANQWHYFMGTFKQINPTTVEAKAYINGVLQAESNLSGNLSNTVNSHDVIIGSTAITGEPFNGLIDEIRISNKAREPFEFVIGKKTIDFIDANSNELVSVDWNSVQAGDYNVYVVIDEGNIFDERNENNNSDYNSITVYVDPTLSVEFELNPSKDIGELFDLNAIIENNGAELLTANAELILPEGLSTTDSLTKSIGNLSSHTSTKIEWTDINSSQAELYEIIVNIKGSNAYENFSAFTSITKIEISELNVNEFIYPDQNIGDFNVINFNPSVSYTGLHYHADINGPENYSEDKNMSILFAGETKKEIIESGWKETGQYTITVYLYNAFDELIDQKQDSFEVVPYTPSMLTYYSTDGLTFDPEFSSYSDYFSSAGDENNQVMVVYSYNGDLNYSIRNPIAQEWSEPQTIGTGSYPYLVGDGNDFHLVYSDENVYYRSYDGSWSSAELVSEMNSVDPVLTFDGSSLYVLFSSQVNGLFNVYLSGFDGNWNTERKLTYCLDANCSNPVVLDEGLVNGKLAYGYRQFKGEEYSTLDSNLMYSLYDVNYFYWGSN